MPDDFDYAGQQARQLPEKSAPAPLLTYGLCGLCVLITLAFLSTEGKPGSLVYQIGNFGYLPVFDIWNGRYYALLTSFFVHGDILHLMFNMLWMWRLGQVLEATLSPLTYILFLCAAAIVGSGVQIAVSSTTGIGASGVVYAMFGLMWAGRGKFAAWRAVATRENLNIFLGWGIFCIFATQFKLMNIANGAHVGGLIFGLAVGFLCFAPRRQPLWTLPLLGLVALTVLSVTWLPWSWQWNFWKGGREFDRKHYVEAISWYERSLQRGGETETCWYNIGAAWHNIALEASKRQDWKTAQKAMAQEKIAAEKAGPEGKKKLEGDSDTEGPDAENSDTKPDNTK